MVTKKNLKSKKKATKTKRNGGFIFSKKGKSYVNTKPFSNPKRNVYIGLQKNDSNSGNDKIDLVIQNENDKNQLQKKRFHCKCDINESKNPDSMYDCNCKIVDDGEDNVEHGMWYPDSLTNLEFDDKCFKNDHPRRGGSIDSKNYEFEINEKDIVYYKNSIKNTWDTVRVIKVHRDSTTPYYTIVTKDGKEKQTVRDKLHFIPIKLDMKPSDTPTDVKLTLQNINANSKKSKKKWDCNCKENEIMKTRKTERKSGFLSRLFNNSRDDDLDNTDEIHSMLKCDCEQKNEDETDTFYHKNRKKCYGSKVDGFSRFTTI